MADPVLRDDERNRIDKVPVHVAQGPLDEHNDGPLARHVEARRQAKRRPELLVQVRQLARLIRETGSADSEHWGALAVAVNELMRGGMMPSDSQLRQLLHPIADSLPTSFELSSRLRLVFKTVDRCAGTRRQKASKPAASATIDVKSVAYLVRGRSLLFIGGDRRPESEQALIEAFELQRLIWRETKPHESIRHFERCIAQPDVAIVALLIRLSSHSFRGIRAFCNRYGKPLVRLPSGYSKNTVANQIMAQCSKRLRTK
jgi:hypothetical protein